MSWTTLYGRVNPNTSGEDVESKYTLTFKRVGRPSIKYNVNADIAVPTVNSAEGALKLKYMKETDVTGNLTFSGTIGEGSLNISLPEGVTISGTITSGPKEIQSFTGSGTWSQA